MAIVSKNLQNKLNNLKTNLQVFVDATGRNPTTEEAKEIMETGSADSVLQKLQNTANTAKRINTHQKLALIAKNIVAFKEQTGREPNSEETKQLLQQTNDVVNTYNAQIRQQQAAPTNDNSNDNSNEYYSNEYYSNDNSDYTPEPAQESGSGNGLLIGGLAVGILGIILLTRGGGKKRK